PEQAGFNVGYIAYNVTHPPFYKLEVRQALDMAVNKQGIIDAVYQSCLLYTSVAADDAPRVCRSVGPVSLKKKNTSNTK
ncbi:ABC transporter substrate-binding protein, partial [Pseudomonas peli]|uniref:ABC transporter substrate-binding protein n=1 Tax=Pseudomonas peli TaxID=592361 RepID=UPI003D31191B